MDSGFANSHETMRAVVWEGKPYEMVVRDVPKPRIQMPEDAIVRITSSTICGTDLHTYHGLLGSANVPYTVGHEAIGVVVEVGSATDTFKVGDRVIVAGLPDDGHFQVEPTLIPALSGYGLSSDYGNLGGLQAEYARVPFADDSLIKIPNNPFDDPQYLFLSDIFCTGWQAVDWSGFQAGDAVAVFGAGPVGLLCAYSALLRGASKVYSIDHVPARLAKAASIGAIPIDFTKAGAGGAAAQLLALEPEGVLRTCDCVGYECVDENLKPDASYILREAVKMTSYGGGIGVAGVYYSGEATAGAPNADRMPAEIPFPVAGFWLKNLTVRGGAADILGKNPLILPLVESGRARPGFIVSSEVGIEDAPEAYRRFDMKKDTKILIRFPWEWESHHNHHHSSSTGSSSAAPPGTGVSAAANGLKVLQLPVRNGMTAAAGDEGVNGLHQQQQQQQQGAKPKASPAPRLFKKGRNGKWITKV